MDRHKSDVWYHETVSEHGFNLTDVCRGEQNGNPGARVDLFVPWPKAVREERGVGQCRPSLTRAARAATTRIMATGGLKAKAKSEGTRTDR